MNEKKETEGKLNMISWKEENQKWELKHKLLRLIHLTIHLPFHISKQNDISSILGYYFSCCVRMPYFFHKGGLKRSMSWLVILLTV